MPYINHNWQDVSDEGEESITVTERIFLGTKCPYCQEEFTSGQKVAKHRCGHAACINCFDNAVHRGWHRCTFCRRSGTARTTRAIVEPVGDGDLGVFIQSENAAAAAAEPTNTSSDDFLPRHIVVKNLIKHHRVEMEKFDNAIGSLIDQLLINRNKRDEHK